MTHLLLTTIAAVLLEGGASIQSIQPLILSMNGFHEITVRLPPQLLEIVSESKNENRNDNKV